MKDLIQIREDVARRVGQIAAALGNWPCRKGCDECCRRLAAVPRVTGEEWSSIEAALDRLPLEAAELARRRIGESAGAARPVICPLLDREAGACLVYEARPVACRAYGFYAEREGVLGCGRIEEISRSAPGVVWGNHAALEERMNALGEAAELPAWLPGK